MPTIAALLREGVLERGGRQREIGPYLAALGRIDASGSTVLVAGEEARRIVATYQLSVLPGLSRQGASRALLKAVRVAADRRCQGIGARLVADAEARARAAGCAVLQLTTDRTRTDAHRFYERIGFEASHLGFKRAPA